MGRYAADTEVSVNSSRDEIERTLKRYGADGFAYGWAESRALVQFKLHGRAIQFLLPLPDPAEKRFTHRQVNQHSALKARTPADAEKQWEQACRQRWRALALAIKAKLETVESGITTFEEEFLAHVILPDGSTVGEWAVPQVAKAYELGRMPAMLPALEAS
jgi:hypothetical protein